MVRGLLAMFLLCALTGTYQSADAQEKKGYHCEVKKNGKTTDDKKIKSRKECKKKGGKWIKDHGDHDHADGEDHEHEED